MKKTFTIILLSLIIFMTTGCGNNENKETENSKPESKNSTITCTMSQTEGGLTTDEKIIIEYSGNILKKVNNTTITDVQSEYMDTILNGAKSVIDTFNDLSGFTYSAEKYTDSSIKYNIIIDFEKIDIKELKDAFGDEYDTMLENYDEDASFEDYKDTLVEDGYICK